VPRATGAAIAPPVSATSFAGTPYSMITKEKSPIRILFFRDHEVVAAGHARRVTGAAIATIVSRRGPYSMIAEIPHAYSARNFHQERSFRDHGARAWRAGGVP
jgi:hypothetical protein